MASTGKQLICPRCEKVMASVWPERDASLRHRLAHTGDRRVDPIEIDDERWRVDRRARRFGERRRTNGFGRPGARNRGSMDCHPWEDTAEEGAATR